MSGVGRIAGETHLAREVAEATLVEAKSVQGTGASQVASLSAQVNNLQSQILKRRGQKKKMNAW